MLPGPPAPWGRNDRVGRQNANRFFQSDGCCVANEHARRDVFQRMQTAETRARFTPDQTKTGCHKYTPDLPQYRDCMAQ